MTREEILESEWLVVRHSGEIPEVAFHGSLHHLTEDPEGPGLELTLEEVHKLEDAALARYREIILRDLNPENRDERIFRGLKRVHHNWFRYARFCEEIDCDGEAFREQAGQALVGYLEQECSEVRSGMRTSSVNCCAAEVRELLEALQVRPDALSLDWTCLCPPENQR
ncbi:MAG: hypothetical protein ACOX5Z_09265 [Desulfobulbus sp.]|jgi:hypothetical protein